MTLSTMRRFALEPWRRANRQLSQQGATLREGLEAAKREVSELGGWGAFKNGEWLPRLIRRAFQRYSEEADHGASLVTAHSSREIEVIAERMILTSAKDAALLGAIVAAIVSVDEVVAIVTAGEGGVGLPANLAIAFIGVASEAVLLVRIHLQLLAGLAKLYGVSFGPHAQDEISSILASALGMSVVRQGQQATKRVRARLVRSVPGYVGKEVFGGISRLGQRTGIKMFERNIMKYGVPVASLVIGSSWNFVTTKTVGHTAQRHLRALAGGREMR